MVNVQPHEITNNLASQIVASSRRPKLCVPPIRSRVNEANSMESISRTSLSRNLAPAKIDVVAISLNLNYDDDDKPPVE